MMDQYQYIYCLPPAGGRIRSQGNKKEPPTASHKGGGGGVGLRNGRRDGREVYEAYEVKNKREKLR